MRRGISKLILTTLSIFYSSLSVFAERADHGRDYSLDDSSSSTSPAFYIIGGIILFIVSLMLFPVGDNTNQKGTDATGSSNNKGCGIGGIIVSIFIILIGISQCGS